MPKPPIIPVQGGRGTDVSGQRADYLDRLCLGDIRDRLAGGCVVSALDLGGGLGAQSIRMAQEGARVDMVDLNDAGTYLVQSVAGANISMIVRDFRDLGPDDLPGAPYDIIYSQRALSYISYNDVQALLRLAASQARDGARFFLSFNGVDTDYGRGHEFLHKPVEERFGHIARDVQETRNAYEKMTVYSPEEVKTLVQSVPLQLEELRETAYANWQVTALPIKSKRLPAAY